MDYKEPIKKLKLSKAESFILGEVLNDCVNLPILEKSVEQFEYEYPGEKLIPLHDLPSLQSIAKKMKNKTVRVLHITSEELYGLQDFLKNLIKISPSDYTKEDGDEDDFNFAQNKVVSLLEKVKVLLK